MQQAIKHLQRELSSIYQEPELSSVARLTISKVTGYSFTELLVNKNTIFSQYQRNLLEFYTEKLKKGTPVQYVLGETEFCGLNFRVNESVLIPRPETEELVAWMVEEAAHDAVILDIGTGSGCIPVSLKNFLPRSTVYGCDISKEALRLAGQNAENNHLHVSFFEMDILAETSSERKYHMIVSNPPYIPASEMNTIHERVKDFEPHLALFVPDNDPLIFYRKIAAYAQQHLFQDGKLFFEIHRDYADECKSVLEESGFEDIQLKKDISGNNRMMRAEKKCKMF
ncbi:MAG: peptide chain release factor N(5)-glutamine methyltransferase [Paludibacter sp.]|nr:peptide chain release factor N(5)-glutamine methyltransferase [Paludibacter sp.]